jgi:hypothetical protein
MVCFYNIVIPEHQSIEMSCAVLLVYETYSDEEGLVSNL